jgi:hypothetical protein
MLVGRDEDEQLKNLGLDLGYGLGIGNEIETETVEQHRHSIVFSSAQSVVAGLESTGRRDVDWPLAQKCLHFVGVLVGQRVNSVKDRRRSWFQLAL